MSPRARFSATLRRCDDLVRLVGLRRLAESSKPHGEVWPTARTQSPCSAIAAEFLHMKEKNTVRIEPPSQALPKSRLLIVTESCAGSKVQ